LPEQGSRHAACFLRLPGEHWKHLRTTNPIESTFATGRHRHDPIEGLPVQQGPRSRWSFKLLEAAQEKLAPFDGTNQLPKPRSGVTFNDGIEQSSPSRPPSAHNRRRLTGPGRHQNWR